MKREVNNSRKCIECGAEVPRKVKRCPPCNSDFLLHRPTYQRSDEHKALMSERLTGRRHTWSSASETPEIAAKIRDWWTPERRKAKSDAIVTRGRYHGLSHGRRKQIVSDAGKCSQCGTATGRLDTHHIDRDKRNQTQSNLVVLCHRCHMREHRNEIGWAAYHRKHAKA